MQNNQGWAEVPAEHSGLWIAADQPAPKRMTRQERAVIDAACKWVKANRVDDCATWEDFGLHVAVKRLKGS